MRCDQARVLMMDRPEERRRCGGQGLAGHMETCEPCREEFSQVQLVAEALGAWADLPVGDQQRTACVARMLSDRTFSAPRDVVAGPWLLPRRWQVALVAALAALIMVLAPVGPGIPGISAEIGHAFNSIEQWKAEGTATPPLLRGPESSVCNHIEVWFARPDRLHVRVDDGPSGPLYTLSREGAETTSFDPHRLVSGSLESEAAGLDMEGLFSVQEWLASRTVLDAPVRDLGLEQFGPRTVRRIQIAPREGWLGADQGGAPILLRVDSETMLPVLLETSVRGSVILLDFQYGVEFPEITPPDSSGVPAP